MQSSLISGRYQIIRTLGQGGFGDTFVVKDLQLPSQRQCVLKSLKIQATSPLMVQEMQRRFQREAAILEGLGEHHSQIPKLYAYFEDHGQFYLVQEWIDGLTLQEVVEKQGCLSPMQVQALLLDLLPVLESIHEKYIIHRDIKPENIILRSSDRKPVLIDFGAVKEALTSAIHDTNAPVSVAIGTPGYMAPEQGTGRPVYSSDLYSLGFTALYLLTGKSPQNFPADPQTGELLWQQDFPYLQSHLGQVLAKSVQFHPRYRFTTAQAMLAALKETTASKTTMTRVVAAPPQVIVAPVVSPAVDPYPAQVTPDRAGGGCGIFLLTLLLSLFGIGAGIWMTISTLGRSPEPQSFPPDPALIPSTDNKPPSTDSNIPESVELPETDPRPTPAPVFQSEPTPTPSTTEQPSFTSNPETTPTPTTNPTPTPTTNPTPTPTTNPTPTPTTNPTPTPTTNPTPTPTTNPTPAPTTNPTPAPTTNPTPTPTTNPTPTPTTNPTPTPETNPAPQQ